MGPSPVQTYIEAEAFRDIVAELRPHTRSRILVIEGPHNCGKTTTLEKALGERFSPQYIETDLRAGRLRTILSPPSPPDYLILEDAHNARRDVWRRCVHVLKNICQEQKAKLVIVGVPHVGRNLLDEVDGLEGRITRIEMKPQPSERIEKLLTTLEDAVNVSLRNKPAFVAEAHGSFCVARHLFREATFFNAAQWEDGDIPTRRVDIDVEPGAIRLQLRRRSFNFDRRFLKIATADSGTSSPGGCLVLLWHMAANGKMKVLFDQASACYPVLKPSFDWMRRGNLQRYLDSTDGGTLGVHVSADSASLMVHDPCFLFYLCTLIPAEWTEHALGMGARFRFEPSPAPMNLDGRGPGALSEARPYPWQEERAESLRDLLMNLYDSKNKVLHLARRVPIRPAHLIEDAGLQPLWNSLIDSAVDQGKLRDLLLVVLQDPEVRGWRKAILTFVPELDAEVNM